MNPFTALTTWLENRWVTPAYSGWLLLILALFFFGAATNTLAGWLYVLSGVMLALLVINAVLSVQTLKGIEIQRSPIEPVSVGESLRLELTLRNSTPRTKALIEICDRIPFVIGKPIKTVARVLPAQKSWHWMAEQVTQRRGIYHWHTLELRTAAPLGLFWCRRSHSVKVTAVVYPLVLSLSQCPILDEMGITQKPLFSSRDRNSKAATEGMTRSLRPYRWGDSTRLIHWRTSARLGNLQIRELETFTGGPDIVIALDSGVSWSEIAFEQAVVAAASLYRYAHQRGYNASLWTAGSGLQHTQQTILEILAGVEPEEVSEARLPPKSCVWLSNSKEQTAFLPANSRWMIWNDAMGSGYSPAIGQSRKSSEGLWIDPEQALLPQLQAG